MSRANYLILVNSKNLMDESFVDTIELVDAPDTNGNVMQAESETYAAYCRMRDDLLEKEGIKIGLDSAYRSVQDQRELVERFTELYGKEYTDAIAATPGMSEHHTGLALDIVPWYEPENKFLLENDDMFAHPELWPVIHATLPKFGFILRYPKDHGFTYEPWHIRYLGDAKVAQEITDKDLSLEQYLAQ